MALFPPLSLADLKRLVLQRIQREGSTFVNTTTELVDYLNLAGEEWLAHLQTLREEAFVDNAAVQVPAGAANVELIVAKYMDKLKALSLVYNGYHYPLRPYNNQEVRDTSSRAWTGDDPPGYQLRQSGITFTYGSSQGTWPLWNLHFTHPPDATCTLTMLFRSGWADLNIQTSSVLVQVPFPRGMILKAAQMCLAKEDRDTSRIENEIARLEKQVEIWAEPTDEAGTQGIRDARSNEHWRSW